MTITRDQAQMLATLACRSRPTGARQWKPDAVMAEIEKVRGRALGAVICAVTRCAMDRNAQRPECISSPGSHWGDTMLVTDWTPDVAPAGERCWCGVTQASHDIRRGRDHPFTSEAEMARRAADTSTDRGRALVAAVRAELAPTAGPTDRKTLEDMAEANPELHARVQAVRDANPGLAAPPMSEPTRDQSYCDVDDHQLCTGYTDDERDPETCMCQCHDDYTITEPPTTHSPDPQPEAAT